eukprot:CAMPEP_0184692766 /NCGR_PEP_ID=MMETSP0313-20130426/1098_1 /TAXON_ID=2792 /ORGANISM="Porphyridium aerugineum, Strain SAG 1380-2" /LENGTH=1297 /DNA_ID=CAMNT_0027150615 /DNA_START=49 /DNA_END=3942 /DNA_ORIENTATION=-
MDARSKSKDAASAVNGAASPQPAALMKVTGVSGKEWALELVKKMHSSPNSAVSLMKQKNLLYVVKRQVVSSDEELAPLLAEVAIWKKACKMGSELYAQFSTSDDVDDSPAPSTMILQSPTSQVPVLTLRDSVVLSKKTGSAKNGIMFLCEFCPSGNVLTWFQKNKDSEIVNEDTLLIIMSQVVSALYLLRESGAKFHANINAEDIYVMDDFPHVRVGGFGLSRIDAISQYESDNSGSPLYEKHDVFAVGMLIIHLAVGTLDDELLEAWNDQKRGEQMDESVKLPKAKYLKEDVRRLVKWCLERKPKNRPLLAELKYEIASALGLVPNGTDSVVDGAGGAPGKEEPKVKGSASPEANPVSRSKSKSDVTEGKSSSQIKKSPSANANPVPQTPSPASKVPAAAQAKAASTPTDAQIRTKSTPLDKTKAATSSPVNVNPAAAAAAAAGTSSLTENQNPNSSLLSKLEDVADSDDDDGGKAVPVKRNKDIETSVNKATEFSGDAPNWKHVRIVLLEVNERKTGPQEMYKALYNRPITKSPTIAFKCFILIHKLILEGPPSFVQISKKQHQFFDWIASIWSKDRNTAVAASKKSASTLAQCFVNDEIGLYSEIIQAKIKFHTDFKDAFEPNWSRTVIKADGSDPLVGKKRNIITRILALMEAYERFINQILKSSDECQKCKTAATPALVLDLSKAYSAVCVLLETVEVEERKRLMPEFAACHYAARAGIELVLSKPEIAELCRSDILVRLDSEPPEFEASSGTMVKRTTSAKAVKPMEAASTAAGKPEKKDMKELIQALSEMGFAEKDAKKALRKSEGELELAIEYLATKQNGGRRNSINTEDTPSTTTMRREFSLDATEKNNKTKEASGAKGVKGAKGEKGEKGEKEEKPKNKEEKAKGSESEGVSSDSSEDPRSFSRKNSSIREDTKEMSSTQNRRNSSPSAPRRRKSLKEAVSQKDLSRPKKGRGGDGSDSHDSDSSDSSHNSRERRKRKSMPRVKSKSTPEKSRMARMRETIPPERARKLVKTAMKGHVDPDIEIDYNTLKMGMQLGQGGFGTVYKAYLEDQPVAVKKIHSNAVENKKTIEEFKREVAVLAALRHPNILCFYGACTRPPNLAIVTEFCERGTLFDLLHKESMPLSWSHVKKFCVETCRGVLYLHECGLLHRDLKSSNLLLDSNLNVKVGDFGLTRLMNQDVTMVQMTGQCGTFQYMAPEVLSSKPYSEKADVFSYGILVWEFCHRKLPYFGLQPMQVGMAVVNQKIRPNIAPNIPIQFVEIMKACWHQDQTKRPTLHQVEVVLANLPY